MEKIEENKRVTPTESYEIMWDGNPAQIVQKEITWAEGNNATRDAIKATPNPQEGVDLVTIQEFKILASIIEAPFLININNLRTIPDSVGTKINNVYRKLNKISDVVAKNSEALPTQEK
ncbi:MAG: hypothetical protein ACTSRU_12790 [Candidatus Hodarchaeales archaeon]